MRGEAKFGIGVAEYVRKKGERRENNVTKGGRKRKANLTTPLPQLFLPISMEGRQKFVLRQYHCQNRREKRKKTCIVAIPLP